MNISDIARMAGVSKGTVSRVINDSPEGVSEETRKRIKKMIEDVGYIPNRVAGSITHARTVPEAMAIRFFWGIPSRISRMKSGI